MNELQNYLKQQADTINQALETLLPLAGERPVRLHEAMRYSVFAGGKRLRPALCISACESCGGTAAQSMRAACALELLHTYTLIHDDLPAMDNDTLRRGHPTCHIAFDEATAILAGDALLTLAFEVLAGIPDIGGSLALELARAAGSRGVIGGQIEDMDAEGKTPDANLVEYIHRNKTAALIRAACVMGGICAGANVQTLEKLTSYGENIGLAFQLADDLLDENATVEELGKDIGSDKARGKMTWPAVHGTEKTAADMRWLETEALAALRGLKNSARLEQLAGFVVRRSF
ncbi:MAG: polyprenyl synthetase family protein [Kiritimatiellaceae bacterium]|nr:polyprenyl synthetase family protein [Kiritimatiellaceae bacterium]